MTRRSRRATQRRDHATTRRTTTSPRAVLVRRQAALAGYDGGPPSSFAIGPKERRIFYYRTGGPRLQSLEAGAALPPGERYDRSRNRRLREVPRGERHRR